MRNEAKESIKEYTTEYLPEQYQVCLTALDEIIKCAFEILNPPKTIEKNCRQWNFKDTHMVKLELLSNATTIDSALNYIRSKQQQAQQKRLASDLIIDDDNNDNDDDQLTITGGRQTVF